MIAMRVKFSSTRANETNDDEELWDVERRMGRKNKEKWGKFIEESRFFYSRRFSKNFRYFSASRDDAQQHNEALLIGNHGRASHTTETFSHTQSKLSIHRHHILSLFSELFSAISNFISPPVHWVTSQISSRFLYHAWINKHKLTTTTKFAGKFDKLSRCCVQWVWYQNEFLHFYSHHHRLRTSLQVWIHISHTTLCIVSSAPTTLLYGNRDRHPIDELEREGARECWQFSIRTAQILVHEWLKCLRINGLEHIKTALIVQLEHQFIALRVGKHACDAVKYRQ